MALLCKSSLLAAMLMVMAVLILVSHTSQAMADSCDEADDANNCALKLYGQARLYTQADDVDVPKVGIHARAGVFRVTGTVVGTSSFLDLFVSSTENPSFNCTGQAEGLISEGAGPFVGTLSTDNVDNLVLQSTSFHFTASAINYFMVFFYSPEGTFLGMIVAPSIAPITGSGAGQISCTFM